jgi:5S rRNA maturation endonuclease (ribonuclease M5)
MPDKPEGKRRDTLADRRRNSPRIGEQKELCYRNAELSHAMGVYSLDADRAERLKETLQQLFEANRHAPVVVEGKRDAQALRQLGFTGTITTVHAGKGLYEFCDGLAETGLPVILLMDWDSKGEQLHRTLAGHLGGLWEEFSSLRDAIKGLCQKDIQEIEGIPGLLERLTGTMVTVGAPPEAPAEED